MKTTVWILSALLFIIRPAFASTPFLDICTAPNNTQEKTLKAIAKFRHLGNQLDSNSCIEIFNHFNAKRNDPSYSVRLDISDSKITDLSPLAYFRSVTILDISNNNIRDLSPIKNLVHLKKIELDDNPIQNIAPLSSLSKLSSISMLGTKIQKISHLTHLKHLKALSISDISIDLHPISQIPSLENLTLIRVPVNDTCTISDLTNLKLLDLYHNNINNINCLESLSNLEKLNIEYNSINDISVVKNYKNLIHISLSNTNITSIRSLKNLQHLKHINLDSTQITDTSPLSGKHVSTFSAQDTTLRWCAPKTGQEVIDGVSCLNPDGSEKPWWKRLLRI